MKRCVIVLAGLFIVGTATVGAQERRLKSSEGRAVFVIDGNRQEWQGRLIRVSAEALEVESDAGIRSFKLAEIRRVDTDGDGVWDGAWKGVAVGAALGLLATLASEDASLALFPNMLSFGALGLAIDASCSSRHPVYQAPAPPKPAASPQDDATSMRIGMRVSW
jgi:hypothetical protein